MLSKSTTTNVQRELSKGALDVAVYGYITSTQVDIGVLGEGWNTINILKYASVLTLMKKSGWDHFCFQQEGWVGSLIRLILKVQKCGHSHQSNRAE